MRQRTWIAVAVALMGCEPGEPGAYRGDVLLVGDSIMVTSSQALIQEGFRRGRHVEFNAHGATPISTNVFFEDWTQTFWAPRSIALRVAGESWECAALSLGTNDPMADPFDVISLDVGYLEPFWLLPLEAIRPGTRSLIQQLIPAERILDVPYTLSADGLHPDAEGARMIARAIFEACEGL